MSPIKRPRSLTYGHGKCKTECFWINPFLRVNLSVYSAFKRMNAYRDIYKKNMHGFVHSSVRVHVCVSSHLPQCQLLIMAGLQEKMCIWVCDFVCAGVRQEVSLCFSKNSLLESTAVEIKMSKNVLKITVLHFLILALFPVLTWLNVTVFESSPTLHKLEKQFNG